MITKGDFFAGVNQVQKTIIILNKLASCARFARLPQTSILCMKLCVALL